MIRRAFTLRLRPGALDEYVPRHDAIWPEPVAEPERQGVNRLTICERNGGF